MSNMDRTDAKLQEIAYRTFLDRSESWKTRSKREKLRQPNSVKLIKKQLRQLNSGDCLFLNKTYGFSFLTFSRFLIVSKGPDLSRKVREAISCNLAPVRSKSDVMEPSYDQKTVLKKKRF